MDRGGDDGRAGTAYHNPMSKFEVDLPPELSDFLQRQVDAGLFKTVADAIEDAVRRSWGEDDARLDAVRAALAPGVAEADAGIYFDGTIDDIIAEAKAARAKQK